MNKAYDTHTYIYRNSDQHIRLNEYLTVCQFKNRRGGGERESAHAFDVAHLFESSWISEVLAEGLFDTDCDTGSGLDLSRSLASRELNSSSNSPGCIPLPVNDALISKIAHVP